MFAPTRYILPLTTIRRERLLPVPGRVVARNNQKVSPLDVVAESHLGQDHILLDVARLLGVSIEESRQMVRCNVGDRVLLNEVIAQRPGLFPKTLRAPSDGRVAAIGGGQLLLEIGDGVFSIRANMSGKVTRLIAERGVEITAHGALIQGIWGNGHVNLGLMLPLMTSPDDVLAATQFDVSLRGSIILAGHCDSPDVLDIANELPIRGMILGSIIPSLLPQAAKMSYPIIVIDGFGKQTMNNPAFKLLTSNAKREVSLNADPFNRHTGTRPEIIIPLPIAEVPEEPRKVQVFSPGLQVRMCRAPNMGEIGRLIHVGSGRTRLPNGLSAHTGEVSLESGKKIIVPLANLEVIG